MGQTPLTFISDLYMENVRPFSAHYPKSALMPNNAKDHGSLKRIIRKSLFFIELQEMDVRDVWFQQDGAPVHGTRIFMSMSKSVKG